MFLITDSQSFVQKVELPETLLREIERVEINQRNRRFTLPTYITGDVKESQESYDSHKHHGRSDNENKILVCTFRPSIVLPSHFKTIRLIKNGM